MMRKERVILENYLRKITKERAKRNGNQTRREQVTIRLGLRIKGCKQEVKQEADGLLHVDLVSGWHPFVKLVKNGGEHSLQAGHIELYVWVQVVQSIFPQCFYDIPNVHQVHYN